MFWKKPNLKFPKRTKATLSALDIPTLDCLARDSHVKPSSLYCAGSESAVMHDRGLDGLVSLCNLM